MIHIFTALYPEAEPLIRHLEMKKDRQERMFQQFSAKDGSVRLTVTGSGPVRAAAAVGCALGRETDVTIVNYGSCAAGKGAEDGVLYRCCKIISADENKTFYPDLLVASGLPEAEIVTQGTVWTGTDRAASNLPLLHDMEAAAIYEAGNLCVGPHRMHFLKFVSDFGSGERVTPAKLREYSGKAAGPALQYIETLHQAESRQPSAPAAADAAGPLLEELSADLHASAAMRAQIKQLLVYALLAGIDAQGAVRKLYEKGKLPAADRRAGLKVLQELKQYLTECQ